MTTKTLLLLTLAATVASADPGPRLQPDDAPLQDTGGRVRWGLSASVGWLVPYPGLTLGGELRLGYQVSRKLSIFGSAGGTISTSSGFSALLFGALAEYMLTDSFSVGAGPVLGYGLLFATEQGVSYRSSTPFMPGVDLRLGWMTGEARPPFFRRSGFNLGIDALLLIHPNAVGERFLVNQPAITTSKTLVTFTPMITVGYDAR